jgi:hypothetical protein
MQHLQQEFPDADLSKISKISYHFTLNGLKCSADRVGQYLSQFLGKPGFDFSAYVKPNGGPRVWTMLNNYKPGCGSVRMEPLTHKDDMSMHLVHYSQQTDMDDAKDITPQIAEAVPHSRKRKQPENGVVTPPSEPETSKRTPTSMDTDSIAPPEDIMQWVNYHWDVSHVTHKDTSELKTQKLGRSEVTQMVYKNIWYVQIQKNRCNVCPIQEEKGLRVEHENHVYIDITECYQSEEHRVQGIRGRDQHVQIRCMHSGSVYKACCTPVDKTKEALEWSESVRNCNLWNERCAFVESNCMFVYTAPGKDPVFYRDARRIQHVMAKYCPAMKVDCWLQHPLRKNYHETDFFPSLDNTVLPKRFVDGTDLNLFNGYGIPPEKAGPGNVQPLLDHILNIWCGGCQTTFEYTLDWFAAVVQKPWERTRVVLVLISKEGTGKGMVITDVVGEIIGQQCFLSESRKDNIFGTFNYLLSCKTLVVLNELLWAGSHEAAGTFKDMITDKRITINQKNHDQRPETAFQNYVICTQGPWAVPASCESRRFFVLEPSERYCGNQTPESVAYFNKVAAVKPEHFAHFLYERDISASTLREVPVTKGLTKQEEQSLTPVQSAIFECLMRGSLCGSSCVGSMDYDYITRRALIRNLTDEFGHQHGFPSSPQKFWQALTTACSAKEQTFMIDCGRCTPNGRPRDLYMKFLPLEECRAFWSKHMFEPSNGWPEETPSDEWEYCDNEIPAQ